MVKRYVLLLLVLCCVATAFASSAVADGPAPGWKVFGYFGPANLPPGGKGFLYLRIYDVGGEPNSGPVTITDTLPDGMEATGGNGCSGRTTVTCEVNASLEPAYIPAYLEIPVRVPVGASGEAVDRVSASGGGALGISSEDIPVRFGSGAAGLGLSNADAWLTGADGNVDTQAGSHPYDFTVVFAANTEVSSLPGHEYEEHATGGEVRTLDVKLPPGLVGNPNAIPQCSRELFDNAETGLKVGKGCPAASQLGMVTLSASGIGEGDSFPIFNLVPPPGLAAQFGFSLTGDTNVFLDARVRSGGDSGITSHTPNVPQRNYLFFSGEFWGVPGESVHDFQRQGAGCVRDGEKNADGRESCGSSAGAAPFFTLPTSCGEPQPFLVEELGSYQNESAYGKSAPFFIHEDNGEPTGFTGCGSLVHFNPSISIAPDTSRADTPAGLTTDLKVPQEVNPNLATSGLKDTTVVLPEGMVVNPGQATGLVACQPSEENIAPGTQAGESEAMDGPPSCPAASKVGEDEVSTPLLPDRLKGSVYVLQSNPPELKLLVAASGDGVNLKIPGTIHLDEATGQLTATFENTPDAPLSEFKLSFSGGAQAALVTPPVCRVYSASSGFAPWSGLQEALVESNFMVDSGPDGTPCENPLPFTPTLTAGSTTDQAGGYTDFSMLLQRGDGQQRIDGLQFKAPAGLTGFLSHVPLCTNTQAEANACPEASKIGHTVVESGPGPYPLVIPEAGQEPAPIYLTEAYGGAPFGLSIVVPIHAGPFTLETQRVRARVEINSITSALTVTTNPLPQVVAGIPTDLREVDAVIERPEFMVNPTNCNPQAFSGTAYGTPPPGLGGAGAQASISSYFQVGACQALKFEPKFTVSTSGKTSKADGASLTAKVTYPSVPQGSDADIGYVKIELPKQLPSRLTTLQKACTSARFEANPAACPSESKIGYATVHTPLLSVPLTGPVIFVSHGGEAFPSLTVVLQGDGVTIDLTGTTFISKAGITSTTFKTIPDDPFSTFELTLPQGKYSALVADVPASAHYSLCGQKLTLPNEFVGQNGAELKQSTAITVTGCAKSKVKKKKKGKRKKAGTKKK